MNLFARPKTRSAKNRHLALTLLLISLPLTAIATEIKPASDCDYVLENSEANNSPTQSARLGVIDHHISDPTYRHEHAYEILNADIASQFKEPELKWILNDPDHFVTEIEKRFAAQKLLTPTTPYQFDYSEFGLPLLKDMNTQLASKTKQLQALKAKNKPGSALAQEITTATSYLSDLAQEVDAHLAAGKISYQDLYEVSYFFSRAIGHFDARTQNYIQKLYLWSDNVLAGYEQFPIEKEYDMYKKRQFSVFTKPAKTGGFIRTSDQFEQAFFDPDQLRMIIVPTNASLNRDIFMRLNHHHIYFIGVTDVPIPADGIDRPGGHFWNHDIRHSTVMYGKRENYLRDLNLSPEKEAALKRQMDVWYLDLLDQIARIPDSKLREAVIFFQFNHHHEKGFPLVPSTYKDPMPNKDPYLLYLMMETNKQHTSFGPKYINKAYQWLKTFWDARAPEEQALTGQIAQLNVDTAIAANGPSGVTLDSGATIEGKLVSAKRDSDSAVAYLQFQGPTRLLKNHVEIPGQGVEQHPHGFGSPVGLLENGSNLALFSDAELNDTGIVVGHDVSLKYRSGVTVQGMVSDIQKGTHGPIVISFNPCRATTGADVLFDPSWGVFDMAVGGSIAKIEIPNYPH